MSALHWGYFLCHTSNTVDALYKWSILFLLSIITWWHENRALSRNRSKIACYNIHKVDKKNDDGFKSESGKLIMPSLNISLWKMTGKNPVLSRSLNFMGQDLFCIVPSKVITFHNLCIILYLFIWQNLVGF